MRSISRNRILLIRYFIGLLAGGYFFVHHTTTRENADGGVSEGR